MLLLFTKAYLCPTLPITVVSSAYLPNETPVYNPFLWRILLFLPALSLDDDLRRFCMFVDKYSRGVCMFIVGKVVDEDDIATFCGTICFM